MSDAADGVRRWLLIDGNRYVVAVVLLASAFLVLLALGAVEVLALDDPAVVRGIAGSFVPGLIAFLSIVLAINQLVLTQEFGSAGEIRERVEEVRAYRHDVEDVAGTEPSPVLPTRFLAFVVGAIEAEARALEASVDAEMEPELKSSVESFASAVRTEAEQARTSLEQTRPGRINALLPVLAYPESRQLLGARHLLHSADALPAGSERALADLTDALELFAVARTEFRTTYTQRVLARLSRQLLYVGLPALFAVVLLGLLPAADAQPSARTVRVLIASAGLTAGFAPLAVLAAYLLRVATISERTIAVGPFASRPAAVQGDRTAERADAADGQTAGGNAPSDPDDRPSDPDDRPSDPDDRPSDPDDRPSEAG